MRMRIDLQLIFEKILGSRNVYFQPPEYIKLKYPCLIYSLDRFDIRYANDEKYKKMKKYTVTYITSTADDIMVENILDLQYCNYDRQFISNNLYHHVFTLYY